MQEHSSVTGAAVHLGTSISASSLLSALESAGVGTADSRLKDLHHDLHTLRKLRGSDEISFADFQLLKLHHILLEKVLNGLLVVSNFAGFTSCMQDLYEQVQDFTGGEVASYIPQLARMEPEQFGVAICTIDGQRWSHGDSKVRFPIQACSKPLTYAMALELHGETKVHHHIGQEPSGSSFKSMELMAVETPGGHGGHGEGGASAHRYVPHNPMTNAGAIMAASLVKAEANEADRFDYVMEIWRKLTGKEHNVSFQNSVYMGERAMPAAGRNFCLGYMMQEEAALPDAVNLLQTLESYFMYCSIEMDTEAMAMAAATLANGGVCPTTGERVFEAKTVQRTLALVQSCGMNDFSGEFAFTVGFPAKSGISGVMMIVIPGVMGIATYSPRVDHHGNSVRGLEFCKAINRVGGFHMFARLGRGVGGGLDRTRRGSTESGTDTEAGAGYGCSEEEGAGGVGRINLKAHCGISIDQRSGALTELWFAAATGDETRVRQLVAGGIDMDMYDYDRRTALHLAASGGHAEVVRYLLLVGADHTQTDVFGKTAVEDAKREGHQAVRDILEAHAAAAAAKGEDARPSTFPIARVASASASVVGVGVPDASLRRLHKRLVPGLHFTMPVPALLQLLLRRLLVSSAIARTGSNGISTAKYPPKQRHTGRIFHKADLVAALTEAGIGLGDGVGIGSAGCSSSSVHTQLVEELRKLPEYFNNWRFLQWLNDMARWPQRRKRKLQQEEQQMHGAKHAQQRSHAHPEESALEIDNTVVKALCGRLAVPNFPLFVQKMEGIFRQAQHARLSEDRAPASFRKNSKHRPTTVALGVCTVDGQSVRFGDSDSGSEGGGNLCFPINELCRPLLYCAMQEEQHGGIGTDEYHTNVGREPQPAAGNGGTGEIANSLMGKQGLDSNGKPFNPMTLAAVITAGAMLDPGKPKQLGDAENREGQAEEREKMGQEKIGQGQAKLREMGKLQTLLRLVAKLEGVPESVGTSSARVNQAHASRQQKASSNIALCMIFMMLESGVIARTSSNGKNGVKEMRHARGMDREKKEGIDSSWEHELLEFVCLASSVESDVDRLAVIAATLASGGLNPLTKERVLASSTVKNCLSMMNSAGMGAQTGQHAFRCGFPAKSSSGGAVMIVIPNVMGACYYSPSGLNRNKQPSRALVFCDLLAANFNFHQFDKIIRGVGGGGGDLGDDSSGVSQVKSDPTMYRMHEQDQYTVQLLKAASEGDLLTVRSLHAIGVNLASVDYDMRSAMHVAAANNEPEVMVFLAEHGGRVTARDRWNNTPMDDARRGGHKQLAEKVSGWLAASSIEEMRRRHHDIGYWEPR
jgi:glutaminase